MNTHHCLALQQRALGSLLAALLAATVSLAAHAATAATAGPAASVAASGAASAPPPPMHGQMPPKKPAPVAPAKLVDINSASRKELKTLPGIGNAEADKIIANRPYLTKTELVTKQVLPSGPYLSLKSLIVAMPKAKPKTTS